MNKYMQDGKSTENADGVKYVLTAVVEHMGPSVSPNEFANGPRKTSD